MCIKCSEGVQDFDKCLLHLWQDVEDHGVCKYKLEIKCKRLPGKFGFVVQSSSQRVQNRRSPQIFVGVDIPFDKKKFNFANIHTSEIMCHINCNESKCKNNKCESHTFIYLDTNINQSNLENVAVVNVSPFAKGHILLVPQLKACRPQILTTDALKLALELQWVSKSFNMVTVFNSMCGQASVNHLHLHSYYLRVPPDDSCDLLIQKVSSPERKLSRYCFVSESIPIPAFYFQVSFHCDIDKICHDVIAIADHLVKRNIAHNLTIVKGESMNCYNADDDDEYSKVLKVFLWPRRKVYKREIGINVGACELSGHVFLPDECYNEITEAEVLDRIKTVALNKDEFEIVVDEVNELLQLLQTKT